MMRRWCALLAAAAAAIIALHVYRGFGAHEASSAGGGAVERGKAKAPLALYISDMREVGERFKGCGAVVPSVDSSFRCPHLIYLWSSGMPLSEDAIPEITLAAEAMGLPVAIVSSDSFGFDSASDSVTESLRNELLEAGARVHYPSIVVFNGWEAQGNAIVGHKRAQGYRALLEPRLAALAAGMERTPAPVGRPAVTSETGRSSRIEMVWSQTMVPGPGNFFRRAPGTRFISYDQRRKVILQHLETGQKMLGPGFIDFVPTPDGALFVTPSHNDGLEFYVASRVFQAARRGRGNRLQPAFRDREMDDQYPSVGILAHEPDVSTTYRILISWFEGLAVRDYEVRWGDVGAITVTPLTPKITACSGMGLSIPMLSKDGKVIAARDEATGTTKLFRLHDDGTCTESYDFGIQTSKVAFTDDGRMIAFSSPVAGGGRRSLTYVFDRETGRTTEIPSSDSRGLVIPEFVGPDSLLFLATDSLGNREFRLVCCVR